jgi:hypothetical protein
VKSGTAALPAPHAKNRVACRVAAVVVGVHVMIRDLSGFVMPFERTKPSEPSRNGA